MAQMNPTQLSIDNGKKALMRHEINQAFDHLFLPALENDEAKRLFLMIINTRCRLFILNEQQIALLKDYAEKGFALAQYAYGRYLEALRPDASALNTANEYFKSAEKAGFGDALYIQAVLFNSGHYGLIDLEESKRMMEEALDMGSIMAERSFLKGYIYGRRDVEADPQKAIDILQAMFNGNESDDISVVDPSYYQLLGDAYYQLEEDKTAEKYYLKAIQMGYTVEHIHSLTKIDRWFLEKLLHIVNLDHRLKQFAQLSELVSFMDNSELLEYLEAPEFVELLYQAKVYGFSDFQIGRALGLENDMNMEQAGLTVREWRKELGVVPTVNQIDTLAAEYPAQTNYLYMSYV